VAAKRRQAGEPTKITGQDMGETAESELVKDPPTQQEPNYPEQEKEHLGDAEKGTGIYASKEDQPETRKRAKPRTSLDIAQERLQRARRTMEREASRQEVKTGPGKLKEAYKASLEARDPIVLQEALQAFTSNYMKLFTMTLEDRSKGEPETLEGAEQGDLVEETEKHPPGCPCDSCPPHE
jgi:hypothetical protein